MAWRAQWHRRHKATPNSRIEPLPLRYRRPTSVAGKVSTRRRRRRNYSPRPKQQHHSQGQHAGELHDYSCRLGGCFTSEPYKIAARYDRKANRPKDWCFISGITTTYSIAELLFKVKCVSHRPTSPGMSGPIGEAQGRRCMKGKGGGAGVLSIPGRHHVGITCHWRSDLRGLRARASSVRKYDGMGLRLELLGISAVPHHNHCHQLLDAVGLDRITRDSPPAATRTHPAVYTA